MTLPCPDEEEITAFLEGTLTHDQSCAIEEHLDICPDCRTLLGTLLSQQSSQGCQVSQPTREPLSQPTTQQLPDIYPKGTICGRYTLLSPIGWGGMGVVYKAFDPDLQRLVAIKLLRATEAPSHEQQDQARLQREAQALARLSHPNVITIFEPGRFQGSRFFAMAFVEGMNLRQWLSATKRTPEEIVHIFQQAGRGLAAVHQAGFVHRDFKPENVLVSHEGNVFVTDFGLVSSTHTTQHTENNAPTDTAELWDSPLTTTNTLVGTPAYMSPEQSERHEVSPLSDQYSFCVALYEALLQTKPFQGATLLERQKAMKAGLPELPPDGAPSTQIPISLWHTLKRGLAYQADARFEDMASCLAALTLQQQRQRPGYWRYVLLACCLIALVSLPSLLALQNPPCQQFSAELAALWSKKRQKRIQSILQSTTPNYDKPQWTKTKQHLDDFMWRLQNAHHNICRDEQPNHPHAQQHFDLRMQCLQRRLDRLSAMLTSIEANTRDSKRIGPIGPLLAAYALPSIHRCNHSRALLQMQTMPPNHKTRRALRGLYQRLINIQMRGCTSSPNSLRALHILQAQAIHFKYNPLLGSIAWSKGILHTCTKQWEQASHSFASAASYASAGKDYTIAISAWSMLIQVLAVQKKFKQATLPIQQIKQIFAHHPSYTREWALLKLRYQLALSFYQQERGQPHKKRRKFMWFYKKSELEMGPMIFGAGQANNASPQARCRIILKKLQQRSVIIEPNNITALCQLEGFQALP